MKRSRFTNGLLATTALAAGLTLQAAQAQAFTLVWADDSVSDVTFDPRVTQSRHEEQVIVQIFDQLIFADENGTKSPGLATAWTVAPDNRSVTLTLRPGVQFHDGTPFNAEAVKFSLESIKDPALGSMGAVDTMGPVASVDVIGPLEVRINYSRPFAAALDSLTENELSIVSPTAVQKLGNRGFAQAPVGTGPFRFANWERGREVVLERNPNYAWGPSFQQNRGVPQVEKIVHRYIANAGTRTAALESGEVHVAERVPPLDMKRLGDGGKFKTTVGVASGLPFSAMFNMSKGPFADIRVRQAFMHAVDRPRMAQNLFFGFAKPAWAPLSPSMAEYWKPAEAMYGFDRAKAASLLDAAGWRVGSGGIREKDGQKLEVFFPSLLSPEAAVAIQADARRVGFDVKVENVLKPKQDELVMGNAYDMLVIQWVSNDPSVLEIPFHSRNISEPGKFKFNWGRLNDPKMDALLEQAGSAATPADRTRLYHEVQKMIMDLAIFLPIHDQVQTVAYTNKLDGLRFARGQWQVRLADARIAQ